ncbi:EAL domain-containing response regulator [Pseudomarimonas salicorniae]|uniref:Bifunctional diguanylate cyclase/phosphodiesterase n=1 Tax=Pseudomarimonas salicorniae TaxID=2933270 RepID=A0ABT0GGZ9_9GAMM|nr:EAL domain-containing protein [Lysobacter sp. CAU 1642]MCK7593811.1 bifunctional diguanylate cyclase/phosphodiesterase [Lysobacter sp. CAU 1642]
MTPRESVVRLLLVEDRVEDAERIASILRNGGMAVRPTKAESEDHFETVIGQQSFDLVVVGAEARLIPMERVVELVEASGKDVPIIAVLNELTDANIQRAFDSGVPRVAPRAHPEILQFSIANAFAAVESRRSVRRLQASLRETERRCDALIESSRDPIAYIHEGMHIRANQAYLEMFGFEEFEEVEGLSLLDLVAPAHAEEFRQLLKRLTKGEPPPKTMQLTAQRGDGSAFEAVMEFAQASYEGEPCLQVIFRQRSIDAEVVRELDELRQRDQVTGLYNRQHFLAEVDHTAARAAEGEKELALLLIEIDNYASVLAEIGLGNTDSLLEACAQRLQKVLGDEQVLARFGEHTFAARLEKSNHKKTAETADKVRAAFDGKILEIGEKSMSIWVSLGAVQIGERIATTQQILGKASQCVNAAMSMGGNRVELFDPAAGDRAEEQRIQERVREIEQALENNSFVLHFQPVISLHGDPGEAYEVLIRMKLPSGELVPPLSFLPEAEEHGLTGRIDRWVIGRALALISERHKLRRDTTLFVNITASSLMDEQLPGLIGRQIAKLGIDGSRLVLEIPESKVFTNLRPAQEFAQALKRFHVGLTLEQFGSGVNSFQVLNHIDADFLRIDRSFMVDLAKNTEHQKKIREIADRARDLGKRTIAEFVQDAASMTVLFTSSVNYVSGNFLAPPGPEMNYEFG